MLKLTLLPDLADDAAPGARDGIVAALHRIAARPEVARSLIEPTLDISYRGGDVLAHFQFADEAAWRAVEPVVEQALAAPEIARTNGILYAGAADGVLEPALADGVYRTLLFHVATPIDGAMRARLERDLLRMPHYIPEIRNWQLSPALRSWGERPWSYAWEQEFVDADALNGPYINHIYHRAVVDLWFDPQYPQGVIDMTLCHSACAMPASLLAP